MMHIDDKLFASNTITDELVEKVHELVLKQGTVKVLFEVIGRTCHYNLAMELKEKLPRLDFEIDYNYICVVSLKGWTPYVDDTFRVSELKVMAEKLGIRLPSNARKWKIIELVKKDKK